MCTLITKSCDTSFVPRTLHLCVHSKIIKRFYSSSTPIHSKTSLDDVVMQLLQLHCLEQTNVKGKIIRFIMCTPNAMLSKCCIRGKFIRKPKDLIRIRTRELLHTSSWRKQIRQLSLLKQLVKARIGSFLFGVTRWFYEIFHCVYYNLIIQNWINLLNLWLF